jgi:hypothetical protein
MIGSPAPQSPPLRLSRAAPRQAARPVRPGHRPAAARPRRRGRACRPPVLGRRHLRLRRRQALRPPRPCRPARGQQPGVIAGPVATSRAGHQRQLPARARSGEYAHGVLATSAPRPAGVMPAGTVCGPRTYRSAHATIIQAGATVLRAFYGDHRRLTVSSDGDPGVIRSFGSFQAAASEAALCRIFAGQYTMIDPWPAARPPCWRLRARLGHFVLGHFGHGASRRSLRKAHSRSQARPARTAPAAAAQVKG